MALNQLTALKVNKLTEVGKYNDGGGLFLNIRNSGSKTWALRFQLNGVRRTMGLGIYDKDINTLANARKVASKARALILDGIDPIERALHEAELKIEKQAQREQARQKKIVTFKYCAERYIKYKSAEWKNAKHKQQWENTLKTYVYPHIGNIPVSDIKTADVRKCLDKIWNTKTETANRVRQRIEAVISSAFALGEREDGNPAVWKGLLDNFYAKPEKIKKKRHIENGTDGHFAALPYEELPTFMTKLVKLDGIAPLALRFLILTAARTKELRLARPEEIDLEKKVWTVPEGRMKGSKRHRIALSEAAIETFKMIPKVEGNDYIFAGWRKGRPLSDGGLLRVLRKRMSIEKHTVHGFRSTFRDFIGEETSFPDRLAEFALAHQLTDEAERAYARGDKLKKRFEMMNAWAKYCDSKLQQNIVVALTKNHHR